MIRAKLTQLPERIAGRCGGGDLCLQPWPRMGIVNLTLAVKPADQILSSEVVGILSRLRICLFHSTAFARYWRSTGWRKSMHFKFAYATH